MEGTQQDAKASRKEMYRGNTQWIVDVLAILTPTAGIVQG